MFNISEGSTIYGIVGAQTEITNFAAGMDTFLANGAAQGLELVKQFLGTPAKVRLTSMSTHQFLDVYFP